MSSSSLDPNNMTIVQLKSWLTDHNIEFDSSTRQKKKYYVDLVNTNTSANTKKRKSLPEPEFDININSDKKSKTSKSKKSIPTKVKDTKVKDTKVKDNKVKDNKVKDTNKDTKVKDTNKDTKVKDTKVKDRTKKRKDVDISIISTPLQPAKKIKTTKPDIIPTSFISPSLMKSSFTLPDNVTPESIEFNTGNKTASKQRIKQRRPLPEPTFVITAPSITPLEKSKTSHKTGIDFPFTPVTSFPQSKLSESNLKTPIIDVNMITESEPMDIDETLTEQQHLFGINQYSHSQYDKQLNPIPFFPPNKISSSDQLDTPSYLSSSFAKEQDFKKSSSTSYRTPNTQPTSFSFYPPQNITPMLHTPQSFTPRISPATPTNLNLQTPNNNNSFQQNLQTPNNNNSFQLSPNYYIPHIHSDAADVSFEELRMLSLQKQQHPPEIEGKKPLLDYFTFTCWIWSLVFLLSVVISYIMFFPKTPIIFCDAGKDKYLDKFDCTLCPQHGHCSNGTLICDPQYVRSGTICIEDEKVIRLAYSMLERTRILLAAKRGNYECNEGETSPFLSEKDLQSELENYYLSIYGNTPETQLNIQDAFIRMKLEMNRGAEKDYISIEGKQYKAKIPYISLSCRFSRFTKQYFAQTIFTIFAILIVIIFFYRKKATIRRERSVKILVDAIRQVLSHNPTHSFPIDHVHDHLLEHGAWDGDPKVWDMAVSLLKKDRRITKAVEVFQSTQKPTWRWDTPLSYESSFTAPSPIQKLNSPPIDRLPHFS